MTSSCGPTPRASSARCRAAVAEFRATACRAPTVAANRSSNNFVRGPVVSQPESSTSRTAAFSRSVIDGRAKGRYGVVSGSVVAICARISRPIGYPRRFLSARPRAGPGSLGAHGFKASPRPRPRHRPPWSSSRRFSSERPSRCAFPGIGARSCTGPVAWGKGARVFNVLKIRTMPVDAGGPRITVGGRPARVTAGPSASSLPDRRAAAAAERGQGRDVARRAAAGGPELRRHVGPGCTDASSRPSPASPDSRSSRFMTRPTGLSGPTRNGCIATSCFRRSSGWTPSTSNGSRCSSTFEILLQDRPDGASLRTDARQPVARARHDRDYWLDGPH